MSEQTKQVAVPSLGHAEKEAEALANWVVGRRNTDLVYELRKSLREVRQQVGALEAKAALADEVFGGSWDDWWEPRWPSIKESVDIECKFCMGLGVSGPESIEHDDNCPKARYDSIRSTVHEE